MQNQAIVHIQNPCSQKWENLQPAEQGRYCEACKKTVIDFSEKSNDEIFAFFVTNPNACGFFAPEQLIASHQEIRKNNLQKWKEYVVLLFFTIASKLIVVTSASAQTFSGSKIEKLDRKPDSYGDIITNSDTVITVSGIVRDIETDLPVEGIKISFLKNPKNDYIAFTDKKGMFKIDVSLSYIYSNKWLYFSKEGFKGEAIDLTKTSPENINAYVTNRIFTPMEDHRITIRTSLGKGGYCKPKRDPASYSRARILINRGTRLVISPFRLIIRKIKSIK